MITPPLPKSAKPKRPSRNWIYFLVFCLASVLLGLAGGGYWVYRELHSDVAALSKAERQKLEASLVAAGYPATEEAWAAKFPPPSESENGALIYEQAFAAMRALPPEHDLIVPYVGNLEPPNAGEPYSPESLAAMRAHLEVNRDALNLAVEAAALPRVVFSSYGYVDDDLSTFVRTGGLLDLILLELENAAIDGDSVRIERALRALHGGAQALDESPNQIDAYIGVSFRRHYYKSPTRVFSHTDTTAELLALMTKLQWRVSDRDAETYVLSRVPDFSLMPEDVVSMFFLMDDKRLFLPVSDAVKARWVDDIVEHHKLVDLKLRSALLELLDGSAEETKPQMVSAIAEFESKASKALSLSSRPMELEGFWLLRANEALFQTTLALEKHTLEVGALPESLERLVPSHLEVIPADPYDGQPIRYTPEGDAYLLYCIGENLADDGGVEYFKRSEQQAKGDVVLRVRR